MITLVQETKGRWWITFWRDPDTVSAFIASVILDFDTHRALISNSDTELDLLDFDMSPDHVVRLRVSYPGQGPKWFRAGIAESVEPITDILI